MALAPGTQLNQYEIVAEIGAGGMDSPRLCQEKSVFLESLFFPSVG